MKKLLAKLALFFFPFLLALGAELFVFPIDTFCFRVSESLSVYRLTHLLPGPYYPDQRIERWDEVGNLGVYTHFAVPRHVLWITDPYGFRYDGDRDSATPYDVVVIGDSNVQGAGLTQSEMLDVQVNRDVGLRVYPYGGYSINEFLADERFRQHPPKVVVYCETEHSIPLLGAMHVTPSVERRFPWNSTARKSFVLVDRALKCTMLHYGQSAFRRWLKRTYYRITAGKNQEPLPFYAVLATDHSMLFWNIETHPVTLSDAELAELAQKLEDYKKEFEKKGIRFIFLPVPNKTSVYWPLVPFKSQPDFLFKLTAAVKARGITAVDTLPAFVQAAALGTKLYQPDDTHWSTDGVILTAHLLEAVADFTKIYNNRLDQK